MHPQVKTKPEDTRARIMDTADALFRRLGFAKTTVADIAAELGMSPANVYRFFPSKSAIVEWICQRCLNELETKVWAVARSPGSSASRLERLFVEIFSYHRDNLITEKRVHDIVLVAMENNWAAIEAHTEMIRAVIEKIVRDGIDKGEFDTIDARDTSVLIKRAMVHFCHPLLVAECLQEGEGETEARDTDPLPAARHHTSRVIDHVLSSMRLTAF